MSSIRPQGFLRDVLNRLSNRWRPGRLLRWLSQQDGAVWISIIQPSAKAQEAGLPRLDDYRGVRAITEAKNGSGTMEWHFFWGSESAADLHEYNVLQKFASPSTNVRRIVLRCIEMRKDAWWKRAVVWVPVVLASAATIVLNLDAISTFVIMAHHKPEMTLERHEEIQIGSKSREESLEVTLWGDPFFRSRLADFSMQILPDPKHPGATTLPDEGIVKIPAWHRSVDISDELKLRLPFENIPAGRYVAYLRGKVHTAWWRWAQFSPQEPLRLDVRDPVSVEKQQVTPWPPEGATDGKFWEALVDLSLVFGRPREVMSNLRVGIPGEWTGWSIDEPFESELKGVTMERVSQNSPKKPKGIVFILRNFPSGEFSSQSVRVRVKAPTSLDKEQWQRIKTKPYVDLL